MYTQAWAQFRTWGRLGAASLVVGMISLSVVVYLDDPAHGKPCLKCSAIFSVE